jgi:hypothetical protein
MTGAWQDYLKGWMGANPVRNPKSPGSPVHRNTETTVILEEIPVMAPEGIPVMTHHVALCRIRKMTRKISRDFRNSRYKQAGSEDTAGFC